MKKLLSRFASYFSLDTIRQVSDFPIENKMRIEFYRCKINIERTFFLCFILLFVQITNLLVYFVTSYHPGFYRQYFYSSCFLSAVCILLIVLIKLCAAKSNDLRVMKRVYRLFWGSFVFSLLLFCYLEFAEKSTLTNYLLLMTAITIIPLLNLKELLIFEGAAFLGEGFALFSFARIYPDIIQLYVISSVAFFVASRMLYQSFVAVNVSQIRLEEQADTDSLTGLLNRRGFERRLACIWGHCVRNHCRVMVSMVDIDFFKRYNDTYGHAAGDRCLVDIAESIAVDFKRSNDIVARFGGEEFLLFATGLSDGKIIEMMNAITNRIEALRIGAGDTSVSDYVTVSIGSVSAYAVPGLSFEELYQKADRELSTAKNRGKNSLSFRSITAMPITDADADIT